MYLKLRGDLRIRKREKCVSMSLTAPIVVTAAQPTMRCAQKSTTSLRLLVQLGVNTLPSFPTCIYMLSSRGGENEIKESEETGGVVEELVAARAQQRSDQKESAETNMPFNFYAVSPLYQ